MPIVHVSIELPYSVLLKTLNYFEAVIRKKDGPYLSLMRFINLNLLYVILVIIMLDCMYIYVVIIFLINKKI